MAIDLDFEIFDFGEGGLCNFVGLNSLLLHFFQQFLGSFRTILNFRAVVKQDVEGIDSLFDTLLFHESNKRIAFLFIFAG
jgi:hypothetical protein